MAKDTMLKVETWDIDKLIPYARNPRKNDEQVDRMASAIKEFGFRIPIIAKSDGSVVDGHLRLKAAQKIGLTEVPVALADELTEAQVKAFRILANQSANWAEWDNDLLKLEFEDLNSLGYDLELTGFDQDSLNAIMAGADEVLEPDVDIEKYTGKIATPVYEPTGKEVPLKECFDTTYMDALVKEIDASSLTDREKAFLRWAATRHIAFNYQNIAEFYSNSSDEMKDLMEKSGLVIIDYNKAIECGFVELSKTIDKIVGHTDDAD